MRAVPIKPIAGNEDRRGCLFVLPRSEYPASISIKTMKSTHHLICSAAFAVASVCVLAPLAASSRPTRLVQHQHPASRYRPRTMGCRALAQSVVIRGSGSCGRSAAAPGPNESNRTKMPWFFLGDSITQGWGDNMGGQLPWRDPGQSWH